ncbi:glycerate kinase [Domibacillus sp. 8LH]|uniref:glycerate kinase n=1 Tax=Domibacillus sp. 8LH TaxID=3073900 RepID=UPI0034E099E1
MRRVNSVRKAADVEKAVKDADLVIPDESRIDRHTICEKKTIGVAKATKNIR